MSAQFSASYRKKAVAVSACFFVCGYFVNSQKATALAAATFNESTP